MLHIKDPSSNESTKLLLLFNLSVLLYLILSVYKKNICGQYGDCAMCGSDYSACGYNVESENCELDRSATDKFEMVTIYLMILCVLIATVILIGKHSGVDEPYLLIIVAILAIMCLGIFIYCPITQFGNRLLGYCVKNTKKTIRCEFKHVIQKFDKVIIIIPIILSIVLCRLLLK